MTLLTKIEERSDYLWVYVEGVESLQFSIDYLSEVSQECRKRNYNKVLLVEELQGQLSMTDMYRLGERLPGLFRDISLAFVDRVQSQYLENRFGEDVAVNRGCNAKVFKTELEAEAWLLLE